MLTKGAFANIKMANIEADGKGGERSYWQNLLRTIFFPFIFIGLFISWFFPERKK